MVSLRSIRVAPGVVVVFVVVLAGGALANGGPFVVKYPNGDPAAKGVLARLGPDLKPGRETRLRVVQEELRVSFGKEQWAPKGRTMPPLVGVTAAYTIENPTADAVEVDFGFPILRGVYMHPLTMVPRPDVEVALAGTRLPATLISNSALYGLIRQRARTTVDEAVRADAKLNELVGAVRRGQNAQLEPARQALRAHLVGQLGWDDRDAALMVEYAAVRLDAPTSVHPRDRVMPTWFGSAQTDDLVRLANANLGPLAAIGEQKATQLLARLASRFSPTAGAAYEEVFSAWGGDVRERSLDLGTGEVRPREVTVDPKALSDPSTQASAFRPGDPTIYARVDYLDANAKITEAERASCRTILKNLPVVFTFAPMNLLHYQAKFPPGARRLLTVSYKQHAYLDTRQPRSYQLSYVVHPASLWDDFGPIHLKVSVPIGVPVRASVSGLTGAGVQQAMQQQAQQPRALPERRSVYRAAVTQKTGELFLATDATAWQNPLSEDEVAQRMAEYRKQDERREPAAAALLPARRARFVRSGLGGPLLVLGLLGVLSALGGCRLVHVRRRAR